MKKETNFRRLGWIAAVLLLTLVSACAGQGGDVTPTEVATAVAALPSDTATIAPSDTIVPTATVTPEPSLTQTPTRTLRPSATATATASATITLTPTPEDTATPTLTLTPSASPTPSATPTRDYPDVTVNRQANCRYGPGTAYLYRWGLYEGDKAEVHGRNWNGSWYWIKPFNLDSHCWASEIVFDTVQGDPKAVPYVERRLPKTTFAGPPGNVQVARNGNEVTISWDVVPLSDDKRRGYMIEANLCQNGAYFPWIIQTDDTSYTFTDEPGCATPSNGLLYTAEKHGYSDPVVLSWP